MTRTTIITLLIFLFYAAKTQAQLQKVIVEKYYIIGAKDTTDLFGGCLEEGSVTYRVYLVLDEGYVLKSLIGDSIRNFTITSTDNFFNHTGFGVDYGIGLNPALLPIGLTGLDSWLTIGYATTSHLGVLKTNDPDTSIVGGKNNIMGLLSEEFPEAGIPIITADGLVLADSFATSYNYGTNISDSTFGTKTRSNVFNFTGNSGGENFFITVGKNSIVGFDSNNYVLIAQLTTKGELAFKINCELINLATNKSLSIFGTDSLIKPEKNEIYSRWLNYPFICGCTDPWFVEYNPEAVCNDGSCSDSIILGCMDVNACNYDPNANYSVAELCCYGPDSCDNRDIKLVCPDYGDKVLNFKMFPNPSGGNLSLVIESVPANAGALLTVYNSFGDKVYVRELSPLYISFNEQLDLSFIPQGIYLIQITTSEGISAHKSFLKK
ncbi:MAG: T9SS type A sorting domain-containing protein [Bacteroidales bacterium]|nr:T9SS type A sorting domain-containing protein [Bacteroidales bacterium]